MERIRFDNQFEYRIEHQNSEEVNPRFGNGFLAKLFSLMLRMRSGTGLLHMENSGNLRIRLPDDR